MYHIQEGENLLWLLGISFRLSQEVYQPEFRALRHLVHLREVVLQVVVAYDLILIEEQLHLAQMREELTLLLE